MPRPLGNRNISKMSFLFHFFHTTYTDQLERLPQRKQQCKRKKQKTKRKQNIFSPFLSGFPNIKRYSSQMGEIAHMTRRVRNRPC